MSGAGASLLLGAPLPGEEPEPRPGSNPASRFLLTAVTRAGRADTRTTLRTQPDRSRPGHPHPRHFSRNASNPFEGSQVTHWVPIQFLAVLQQSLYLLPRKICPVEKQPKPECYRITPFLEGSIGKMWANCWYTMDRKEDEYMSPLPSSVGQGKTTISILTSQTLKWNKEQLWPGKTLPQRGKGTGNFPRMVGIQCSSFTNRCSIQL